DFAASTSRYARVIALTAALTALMRRDGPWTEAKARHSFAAQAARHVRDRLAEANAVTDLGVARHLSGDYGGAAGTFEEALRIYRAIGERLGQANALTELGTARLYSGDPAGASQVLETALS